jgi:dinuclear metal center YbgI/SA1388 family protein
MPRLRNEIVAYLNEFLEVTKIEDSSFNGLQVEGKDEISRIAFAVDGGIEVFEKAKQLNADMLIVHHGLFWEGVDPRFIGVNKKRLQTLISADMSLYAVHLPLDMHASVGNNVELLRIVKADMTGRFLNYHNSFIGAVGKFAAPQKVSQIAKILEDTLDAKTQVLGLSRESSTVAAASGGVSLSTVNYAKEAGADLLIVGEKRDFYHLANDLGVSVIFIGHHASEQVGIWALQKHVSEKFPEVECVYVKCPTGL